MNEHLKSAVDKLQGVELTLDEWRAVTAAVEDRVGDVDAFGADATKGLLNWSVLRRPGSADPFIWGGDGPSLQEGVMGGPISNGDLGSGRVRGD